MCSVYPLHTTHLQTATEPCITDTSKQRRAFDGNFQTIFIATTKHLNKLLNVQCQGK